MCLLDSRFQKKQHSVTPSDEEDSISMGSGDEVSNTDTGFDDWECEYQEDGHSFDDMQVPFTAPMHTITNIKSVQGAGIAASCRFNVDINNKMEYKNHCAECSACKNAKININELMKYNAIWLLDSGASAHFTSDITEFAKYSPRDDLCQATTSTTSSLICQQMTNALTDPIMPSHFSIVPSHSISHALTPLNPH
jgi:hypothetical protein